MSVSFVYVFCPAATAAALLHETTRQQGWLRVLHETTRQQGWLRVLQTSSPLFTYNTYTYRCCTHVPQVLYWCTTGAVLMYHHGTCTADLPCGVREWRAATPAALRT